MKQVRDKTDEVNRALYGKDWDIPPTSSEMPKQKKMQSAHEETPMFLPETTSSGLVGY